MTLRQFFEWVQSRPSIIIYYFIILLIITIIASLFAKDQGREAPWNWLYSVIIYMVCIPGIFAITLNIYLFLFERRSILETDLLLQVLPVAMMCITLFVIHRNVELKYIPGFEKLSSLMVIIGILLGFMWILDRTRLFAISFIPFYFVLIILIGGIYALRAAFRKLL